MKICLLKPSFLAVLVATLSSVLAFNVVGQTFTTQHSFNSANGSDGNEPIGALKLSGQTLFGTTVAGGSGGASGTAGTVFKVDIDGTGFMTLHSFTGGSDEGVPNGGLILSSNALYGTAMGGINSNGNSYNGTVFKVNIDGTGFTTLYSFTGGSDGANPQDGLVLSGNALYGTANGGGSSGNGTVFKVNMDGTGFATLHSFTTTPVSTNSDGANPYGGLVLSGNVLYGTANGGGSSGNGTVFKVNIDGTGFATLYSFSGGNDGAGPYDFGGLVLSGNTLYGTAIYGGNSGNGTVFKVNIDGTGFTTLYSFTPGLGQYYLTNNDGALPYDGLALSGNTLCGTANVGGSVGHGTVFKVNVDGTGFTMLHSFTAAPGQYLTNSDGAFPMGGLVTSGNTLYGTATQGGSADNGTVFSISLGSVSVPVSPLTITVSQTNVLLTWPTNATGFTLQSSTNLALAAAWTNVSPGSVVVNGINVVTNPISGQWHFYRLSQ
jgi:uncharacterized repeat protein (TIGR03803 family)